MPTLAKAELIDTETAWLEIWERMYQGLLPRAREILVGLGYYEERARTVPDADSPLAGDENAEFERIVANLTKAAVSSQIMRDSVLVATLNHLMRNPSVFSLVATPAAVQWAVASSYQRGEEAPGTFAMDIWGTDQTAVPYIFGEPTHKNIARAAKRAAQEIQAGRLPGRPPHPAHDILAGLGPIFRASGIPIVRHTEKQVRREHGEDVVTRVETGPFYDFLKVVLSPLQEFLRARRLPPITIDSVVRIAIKPRR